MEWKPLLTIPEVADVLRVKYHTVSNLIHTGKLVAMKVGGMWRIRPEALDKYLDTVTTGRKENDA